MLVAPFPLLSFPPEYLSRHAQELMHAASLLTRETPRTFAHIQLYDCYRNCLPFLDEYRATYRKSAFADPYIKYKWCVPSRP